MALQNSRVLKFTLWAQTPKSYSFVSRCRCNIWAALSAQSLRSLRMESNTDDSICMSFESGSQHAIRDSPDLTLTTPSWWRKKILVRAQASSRDTSSVSVLRLLDIKLPNRIQECLKLLIFRFVRGYQRSSLLWILQSLLRLFYAKLCNFEPGFLQWFVSFRVKYFVFLNLGAIVSR